MYSRSLLEFTLELMSCIYPLWKRRALWCTVQCKSTKISETQVEENTRPLHWSFILNWWRCWHPDLDSKDIKNAVWMIAVGFFWNTLVRFTVFNPESGTTPGCRYSSFSTSVPWNRYFKYLSSFPIRICALYVFNIIFLLICTNVAKQNLKMIVLLNQVRFL